MSAAVTCAGPCLRRYIDDRLVVLARRRRGCLMLRMISVTSSLTPGTVVNSCRTPSMRMLVTAAPGIEDSRRAAQGVAEGVAEAGLQRLDDEPASGTRDDSLRSEWDAVR